GAIIGGEIHEGMHKAAKRHHRHAVRTGSVAAASTPERADKGKTWMSKVVDAINTAALLFLFGAVMRALLPERMEMLKGQIASRPLRLLAMGIVSVPAGVILAAAVCLTVIGIPVVAFALLATAVGTLAGICSVLETVGGALLAHRTKNPYVHLA